MERHPLGPTDLRPTRLGMGCVKLASLSAGQTQRRAVRLVDAAYGAGIRLFDTADAYGGASETTLGNALRRRDDAVIATKVGYRFRPSSTIRAIVRGVAGAMPIGRAGSRPGATYSEKDFTADYVRAAVIASLRRLRVDHIDLLQFHAPPDPESTEMPVVVGDLIADGLVRWFGIGCERLETAQAWQAVDGLASVQLPFGVLDPQAAAELLPALRQRNIGVIVRGVLGGGVLARFVRGQPTGLEPVRERRVQRLAELAADADTDVLQLAVWFVAARHDVDAILLGITDAEELTNDVRLITSTPPPGLVEQIEAIIEDLPA